MARKALLASLLLLLTSCGDAPSLPPLEAAKGPTPELGPVTVGEWTIRTQHISQAGGGRWRGIAERPDGQGGRSVVELEVPAGDQWHTDRREVRSAPLRKVVAYAGSMSASPSDAEPRSVIVDRGFLALGEDGKPYLEVISRGVVHRPQVDFKECGAVYRDGVRKALESAEEDPAIELLSRLADEKIILEKFSAPHGPAKVWASVDGAEFVELPPNDRKIPKGTRSSRTLAARPGQEVSLRFRIESTRYTVTSRGIELRPDSSPPVGGPTVSVARRQAGFDVGGFAVIPAFELTGPQALRYEIDYGPDSREKAFIFLRWGRPEEPFLASTHLRTAPALTGPTDADCVQRILRDLETSWDPDFGCWIADPGGTGAWTPRGAAVSALVGLDLDKFPHLEALRASGRHEKHFMHFESARHWLADRGDGGPPRSVETRTGDRFAWHGPEYALALAHLASRDAPPDAMNLLEGLLDFWAEAIPHHPDAFVFSGKSGFHGPKPDIDSNLCAMVALQRGFDLFAKPEYLRMRDAQFKRLRELTEEQGILAAMRGAAGLDRGSFFERDLPRGIVLYGQACALVDDEAGLAEAKGWIRRALAHQRKPYGIYRDASLTDRLGLLTVMRGRAAMLDPPVGR